MQAWGKAAAAVTLAAALGISCAPRAPSTWRAAHARSHPLVGKIYRVSADARSAAPVNAETLVRDLTGIDYVLLGEQHDNPDHHRLQAWVFERLARAGRRPALVMEMLDSDKQAAVSAFLDKPRPRAAGFGRAVGWRARGWPDYRMYAPLVGVALRHRLPIVAGNLSKDVVGALRAHGDSDDNRALLDALDLYDPMAPDEREGLAADVVRAHCGYANETFVKKMVTIQHARDLSMTRSIQRYRSAVLIAGAGHVRTDRAVGALLARSSRRPSVTAVAFVEVSEGVDSPQEYAQGFAAGRLPFDYVWFTPRVSDRDPCERFRKQLEERLGPAHTGPKQAS